MNSGDVEGRRVDAHHHVWDLSRRPQPWTDGLAPLQRSFSLDDLTPDLAAHRVGATVVVQTVPCLDETHELIDLADKNPQVAGVVGWFDLESPDLGDRVLEARARPGGHRLVGARHQLQVEADKRWLSRREVRKGLETLAGHGLAYDLVVSPEQLRLVTETVAALPGVRFVLDHAGKPPIADGDLAAWRGDLLRLARHDNVTVKLSGLVTEADWERWTVDDLRPVAETVLAAFGPERTMFGSDWPVCLLAGADYGRVIEVVEELVGGLDRAERAQVWGETARRFYGLELM